MKPVNQRTKKRTPPMQGTSVRVSPQHWQLNKRKVKGQELGLELLGIPNIYLTVDIFWLKNLLSTDQHLSTIDMMMIPCTGIYYPYVFRCLRDHQPHVWITRSPGRRSGPIFADDGTGAAAVRRRSDGRVVGSKLFASTQRPAAFAIWGRCFLHINF